VFLGSGQPLIEVVAYATKNGRERERKGKRGDEEEKDFGIRAPFNCFTVKA